MAKRFLCSPGPTHRLRFGSASLDLLSEALISLNHSNKDALGHLEPCSGCFKHKALIGKIVFILLGMCTVVCTIMST